MRTCAGIALVVFVSVAGVCLCPRVRAQNNNVAPQSFPSFSRVRAQSLDTCRNLALKRGGNITLAATQLAQARADLADQQSRIKINTAGGLDPFDGQVRFYLSLDLERLFQMNKQAREKAKQQVNAQNIAGEEAKAVTLRRVTGAWYALRRAEANLTSAVEAEQTAQALHVAADARFKAGQGELSTVLSSLRATRQAKDAISEANQALALACLDLAQACGYATAEQMEADRK